MKDILFSVLSAGSFWDRTYGPEAYTRPAHCRTAEAGSRRWAKRQLGLAVMVIAAIAISMLGLLYFGPIP
jgi:hypothetical protein